MAQGRHQRSQYFSSSLLGATTHRRVDARVAKDTRWGDALTAHDAFQLHADRLADCAACRIFLVGKCVNAASTKVFERVAHQLGHRFSCQALALTTCPAPEADFKLWNCPVDRMQARAGDQRIRCVECKVYEGGAFDKCRSALSAIRFRGSNRGFKHRPRQRGWPCAKLLERFHNRFMNKLTITGSRTAQEQSVGSQFVGDVTKAGVAGHVWPSRLPKNKRSDPACRGKPYRWMGQRLAGHDKVHVVVLIVTHPRLPSHEWQVRFQVGTSAGGEQAG